MCNQPGAAGANSLPPPPPPPPPEVEEKFNEMAGADQKMNEAEFEAFMQEMGDDPSLKEVQGKSFEEIAGNDGEVTFNELAEAAAPDVPTEKGSKLLEEVFNDMAGVDGAMNEPEFNAFMDKVGDDPALKELQGKSFKEIAGNDGKLTLDELKTAVTPGKSKSGGKSEVDPSSPEFAGQAKNFIDRYDTNKNGELTKQELSAVKPKNEADAAMKKFLEGNFDKINSDGSAGISAKEVQTFAGKSSKSGNTGEIDPSSPEFAGQAKSFVNRYDANNDGELTKQELSAVKPKNEADAAMKTFLESNFDEINCDNSAGISAEDIQTFADGASKDGKTEGKTKSADPDFSGEVKEFLNRNDPNGDGRLTKEEVESIVPKDGYESGIKKFVLDNFDAIDADGSTTVSGKEVDAFVETVGQSKEFLSRNDPNKDGRVTKQELEAIKPKNDQEKVLKEFLLDNFDKIDADGSTTISSKEVDSIIESVVNPTKSLAAKGLDPSSPETLEKVESFLARHDPEGDGFLNKQEIEEIVPKNKDEEAIKEFLLKNFDNIDVDNNNLLRVEEVKNFFESAAPASRQGEPPTTVAEALEAYKDAKSAYEANPTKENEAKLWEAAKNLFELLDKEMNA